LAWSEIRRSRPLHGIRENPHQRLRRESQSIRFRCHETGAICEAYKLHEAVTASVCVSREDGLSPFVILPPCGICCDRLAFWGGDVEVAIPQSFL
jgi:cytidine deaminase